MVQNASNSLQIYALSFEDIGQIVGKRDLFGEILMPQLFTKKSYIANELFNVIVHIEGL